MAKNIIVDPELRREFVVGVAEGVGAAQFEDRQALKQAEMLPEGLYISRRDLAAFDRLRKKGQPATEG